MDIRPPRVGWIGANLRRERQRVGLPLTELARRAGVARQTLTALEAGSGNPTIETLYALADALGVTLGSLLAEPQDRPVRVVRAGGGQRVDGPFEVSLLERVDSSVSGVEIYVVRIGPGGEGPREDVHAYPVTEHVLVEEGWVRCGPPDEPIELGPGDYASFPGDRPHRYEAINDEARLTIVMVARRPEA
jgi:transcriptional regulator with XRE-family HTH domain